MEIILTLKLHFFAWMPCNLFNKSCHYYKPVSTVSPLHPWIQLTGLKFFRSYYMHILNIPCSYFSEATTNIFL